MSDSCQLKWTLDTKMGSKTPPDTLPPQTQVKKENEEEIKEFAETAMNELLGWYGYERLELRRWAASRAKDGSSPEHSGEQKNKDECTWCNKRTREGGAIQHAGSTYCSELCFSQSRRANFKRAKTCDWCRHVRHTVAYVDFQDGATQLQFCSDKCLNQYKMHIFCRETQAHLDLNPHLVNAASSSNLITPDLWLKNCRSRSTSPASEKSRSPHPDTDAPVKSKSIEKDTPTNLTQTKPRKSPIPLISVAPSAKLMKKGSEERTQHSPEKKKDGRLKMNLRRRRTSKCSATVTSQSLRQRSTTPKAQDLRMHSPSEASSPLSTANSALHSPPNHINHLPMPPPPFQNPMFGMSPSFVENGHDFRHPMFSPRLPSFLPRPGMPLPDRLRPSFPQPINQPPPITVLVPYPVILPIPLPIPIPIPMSTFIQAHKLNKVKTEAKDDSEGPLDFTMSSEKKSESTVKQLAATETEQRSHDINDNQEVKERLEDNEVVDTENGNPEQTLPKFKITRLGNKMAKIVTKPREVPESSRPLRKRRRLVEVVTEDDTLNVAKTRKTVEV